MPRHDRLFLFLNDEKAKHDLSIWSSCKSNSPSKKGNFLTSYTRE